MRRLRRRVLYEADILAWADDFFQATGRWPTRNSGGVATAKFETWNGVDGALKRGLRGLPGGSSLAKLLAEHRGVRNVHSRPPLTAELALVWADAWHAKTGDFPTAESGIIPGAGGEKWCHVDNALRSGLRGFPGGSSLAKFLAEHRGVRNLKQLPPLTEEEILAWLDAEHQRSGIWASYKLGPIVDAPGETWAAVDAALRDGQRGLPGGSSLADLLVRCRSVRSRRSPCLLSEGKILAWADAWQRRTGTWPNAQSGPIPEAPGETWTGINLALRRKKRGLVEGCTLAELLATHRGVRNRVNLPRLRRREIAVWARAHFHREGKWPTHLSGPILEAPGETWAAVHAALVQGGRGLRGGSSLAQLLAEEGLRPNHRGQPPLSRKKILRWAEFHYHRTGQWPHAGSGDVVDAPGERWDRIDNSLRRGNRGLTGGSSLAQLLAKKCALRNRAALPPYTLEEVYRWAENYRGRSGSRPTRDSGAITEAPGETWAAVDAALRNGGRGLTGGSSLAQLLDGKANLAGPGAEERPVAGG
jgi:hypothetical protein